MCAIMHYQISFPQQPYGRHYDDASFYKEKSRDLGEVECHAQGHTHTHLTDLELSAGASDTSGCPAAPSPTHLANFQSDLFMCSNSLPLYFKATVKEVNQ